METLRMTAIVGVAWTRRLRTHRKSQPRPPVTGRALALSQSTVTLDHNHVSLRREPGFHGAAGAPGGGQAQSHVSARPAVEYAYRLVEVHASTLVISQRRDSCEDPHRNG